MVSNVLSYLALVEVSLRQQRTGDRTEREQEQQHQRGAHRGQRPPAVAQPRQYAPQIGSLASDTNASRSHATKSFHSPVTNAIPTRISSTPPKIWMPRV